MNKKNEFKKRILVCDDDPGILEVMQIILEQFEYSVKTVPSGKAIQKVIQDYKPDMIFLDIWMPGIDGKEVTKILKRDKKTAQIPIVVISALNDTEKIATDSGADGFLSKPFTMENLIETVKRHTTTK